MKGASVEVGQIYGNVEVLELLPVVKIGKRKNRTAGTALCKCVLCGTIKRMLTSNIKNRDAKSCGCKAATGINPSIRKEPGYAASRSLYTAYQKDAKKRAHEFALSMDDFLRLCKMPCAYCGRINFSELNTKYKSGPQKGRFKYNGSFQYNGIDRVDNAIGYLTSNCVPCCTQCNIAKYTWSSDDFITWIKLVYEHLIKNQNGQLQS